MLLLLLLLPLQVVRPAAGPLGHRQGLLTAINDLEQYWQQQLEQRRQATAAAGSEAGDSDWEGASIGGGGGGSRPGSPSPAVAGAGGDYSLQRAYAQRARLARELDKAEEREALRKV